MNPLLRKEIRLLLPAWGLTLLLALCGAFIFHWQDQPRDAVESFSPVWFGVAILCASSFGREFSLGTFSSLLAQPFPRRHYWMTKVGVLVVALVSVLAVYGCGTSPSALMATGWTETAWLAVLLLVAVAGGLWLALLVRQMLAVIWLVVLAPAALCGLCLLVLSHFNAEDGTVEATLYGLLLIYAVGGIISSWVIFRRAQDAPWSGGTINVPAWIVSNVTPHIGRANSDARGGAPWRALIRKEFHFNQELLWGMGGLFLLDLGEVWVRFLRRHASSDFNSAAQVLGIVLWVLMPLIIGCTSIAEERKLGTMEGQLCQPVSRRRQFLVKLGFILLFGGVLSSLLPMVAEVFASALGIHNAVPEPLLFLLMVAGMCALALVGFFASSLSRNMLQALPMAIGLYIGISLLISVFFYRSGFAEFGASAWFPGVVLWNPLLPSLLLAVLLPLMLVWLSYRNFQSLYESTRILWRNTTGVVAVVVITMAASVPIYHRVWEKLTPFEPAHGAARWTMSRRPVAVHSDLSVDLLLSLPDGQHWFGSLTQSHSFEIQNPRLREWFNLLMPAPRPLLTVNQIIPGTNWISLAAGHLDVWFQTEPTSSGGSDDAPPRVEHIKASRETVAVRSDGTLWVSAKAGGPDWNNGPLVQFGAENDWKQVVGERYLQSVLLLKSNGTLWRWGKEIRWWTNAASTVEGLRAQSPRQINPDADWQKLFFHGWGPVAQKADGNVWNLWHGDARHPDIFELNTNLASAGFARRDLDNQKISKGYSGVSAGIRPDGTLWIWGDYLYHDRAREGKFAQIEASADTNWVAVAVGWNQMVALKSDGTLWRWSPEYFRDDADAYRTAPARLGIHADWVAMDETEFGPVSVAADGSLWLWPEKGGDTSLGALQLIAPRQKPVSLGNIFAANE